MREWAMQLFDLFDLTRCLQISGMALLACTTLSSVQLALADGREDVAMSRSHQPDEGVFRGIHSEDIEWRVFPAFPPAARLAVLVGDPSQPGPYVIRVRLPADTKMMPHKHPEDRIYTVLSGVFYIGLGEEFDENRLMAFGVGSVIVLPGGQAHFHWAKSGEYITQVTAIGPLGLSYVHPADDPRSQAPAR
jgi:quercetin dioxygenase-like cupin family protein